MSNAQLSFALEYIGQLIDEKNHRVKIVQDCCYLMKRCLNDESPLVREGALIGLEYIGDKHKKRVERLGIIKKIELMTFEDESEIIQSMCEDFLKEWEKI